MEKQNSRASGFFSNRDCECFPCHETDRPEDFNCLFCYCPLYTLGPECGGDFAYTEQGVKDCSRCTLPHGRDAAERIRAKCGRLIDLAKG